MNKQDVIISDFLNIEYDFIEYYVGMAKMVTYWHVSALGFEVIAYAGPETGVEDKCSYYIKKNDIKLVITSASQPSSHDIVSFVDLHGNAIKRMAIRVENVNAFFENVLFNGAIPLQYPSKISDKNGYVEQASLKMFDDNEIMLINYDNYHGAFIPGYQSVKEEWISINEDTALEKIDHVACALRLNEIKLWEKYINNIFTSKTVLEFDERQKEGEKKIGMLLKVLQSGNGEVNNVLVEPDNKIKTQVQLFLDHNHGVGIQHVAFKSNNIFKSVEILKSKGVRFTKYPDSYYDTLKEKYPQLDIMTLKEHGVLCDVIDDSLLFQIFTTPLGDRPTFFYEIVQRVNDYKGFGLDNIYALFEAMENELQQIDKTSLS